MTSDIGKIGWIDMTGENADSLKDFYSQVTGWQPVPVSMGDYNDYSMCPTGSEDPVAGVCHRKGGNSDLPSGWIIYINVENVEKSVEACRNRGGEPLTEIKSMPGYGRYCFLKDPEGNSFAVFEKEI